MIVRDWSQQWLPLFLLTCVQLIDLPAEGNPLGGRYDVRLRNDASRQAEASQRIGGVHSVDFHGALTLPDEMSEDHLSSAYAVNGTSHDFGFQMNVDAGHRATDSMAWSTLELSLQDTVTVLDENGGPLDWRRRPLRDALSFHLSFRGILQFEPVDSLPTDPSSDSRVEGEALIAFHPAASALVGRGWAFNLSDTPPELPMQDRLGFDFARIRPTVFTYDTSGTPVSYQWRFSARTQATSGAISINAPDFFRIDAITFRDGTTPESHGFSLRFQSGLTSPNLRVPEPSAVLLLASAVGVCGILRFREVAGVTTV